MIRTNRVLVSTRHLPQPCTDFSFERDPNTPWLLGCLYNKNDPPPRNSIDGRKYCLVFRLEDNISTLVKELDWASVETLREGHSMSPTSLYADLMQSRTGTMMYMPVFNGAILVSTWFRCALTAVSSSKTLKNPL
jgi:hypothetical protein